MTDEQEANLAEIKADFNKEVSLKYAKGALEHGGNIWDLTQLQLINNAMDEAVDQYVYLHTERKKILDNMQ